jgi:hypothetical protein
MFGRWRCFWLVPPRTGKDGKKYLTRWKGFDPKADTYEPEANLLGSKDLLAQFNKEQDALIEADHKAAKEKHEQAVAAKRLRGGVTRHTPARLC